MVSEQQENSNPQSHQKHSILDASVTLYRKTLKRFRTIHLAAHWLATHTAIPVLERLRDFRTLPDDPLWFRLELLTYRHEAETVQQFRSLLRPGATLLDIGAHVGYYARMGAEGVGNNGRVIAFEPHPRNFAMLNHNTRHYDNITTLQVALAEEEGTAQLHDYLMMSASGSLHFDESLRDVQQAQMSEQDFAPRGRDFQPMIYEVRTAPIDVLLADLGITQVDVIKMDIEGAELGALRGMRQTIERSPSLALVMEYNPLGLKAFDNDPQDALREVLALGFDEMFVIEAGGYLTNYTGDEARIDELTQSLVHHMGVVNLLFRRQPKK